jgi:hypothetical protein
MEGTLAELRAKTGCTSLVEMFRSFFHPVHAREPANTNPG